MTVTSIEITGLKVFANHGVIDQERICGNLFEIDVVLRYPFLEAARADNINATLNYAEAVELIKNEMSIPAQLIEHVAWRISRRLTDRWPLIQGGTIKVAKLTPPLPGTTVESVSASISW